MTTFQEYLNTKNKTEIKEINLAQISEEREKEGINELLEGGELDLREFINLESVIIGTNFLKTPLTKIEVDGLTKLKELILPQQIIETEAEKELWTELGISENSSENTKKKKVVQEVKRLAELKKVQVHFGNEEYEATSEKEAEESSEKTDPRDIFLLLEKKDKQGNFCPNLIFWTLAQELTLIDHKNYEQDPLFWNNFAEELNWVKENISAEYQKEFKLLFNPATFPHELLEIDKLLTIYYPNAKDKENFFSKLTKISKGIVDKTWKMVREKIIELTDQTVSQNPSEEELAKLAIKATINYNSSEQEYTIQANYHPQNPFKEQLEELITTAPLKLEIEYLKQKQEQLPTSENFAKVVQEKEKLKNSLRNYTDEGEYQEILKKIQEETN